MNKEISKEILYRFYIEEKRPMKEVSKMLNIAVGTVHKYLHKYQIETRDIHYCDKYRRKKTKEARARISKMHKGKKLSEETKNKISESHKLTSAGHEKLRADGYIGVYYPNHSSADKSGYIMKHRLIMGKHINRELLKTEVVHHINGNRKDNHLENLKLMTFVEHAKLHMTIRHEKRRNAI
jgi:hypothetical protein